MNYLRKCTLNNENIRIDFSRLFFFFFDDVLCTLPPCVYNLIWKRCIPFFDILHVRKSSIFRFFSDRHLRYRLIIWRSYYIRYYTRFQDMRYPMALNTPGQPVVHMHHLIFLPCEVSNFHPKSAFFKIRHYMCVGCFRILANHWVITTRESKDRNGPMQWEVTNHI